MLFDFLHFFINIYKNGTNIENVKMLKKQEIYGIIKKNKREGKIKMENNDLEKEIIQIKERNKRVELDKAWETSWTRKICIMILTYVVVIIYSYVIRNIDNIFLSSLVPVIGFTLSTLSLKLVRKIWEKNK